MAKEEGSNCVQDIQIQANVDKSPTKMLTAKWDKELENQSTGNLQDHFTTSWGNHLRKLLHGPWTVCFTISVNFGTPLLHVFWLDIISL